MATAPLPIAHLEQLASIRRRLSNLSPDYNRPDRFYRKRDDLVDELHQLGRAR